MEFNSNFNSPLKEKDKPFVEKDKKKPTKTIDILVKNDDPKKEKTKSEKNDDDFLNKSGTDKKKSSEVRIDLEKKNDLKNIISEKKEKDDDFLKPKNNDKKVDDFLKKNSI